MGQALQTNVTALQSRIHSWHDMCTWHMLCHSRARCHCQIININDCLASHQGSMHSLCYVLLHESGWCHRLSGCVSSHHLYHTMASVIVDLSPLFVTAYERSCSDPCRVLLVAIPKRSHAGLSFLLQHRVQPDWTIQHVGSVSTCIWLVSMHVSRYETVKAK